MSVTVTRAPQGWDPTLYAVQQETGNTTSTLTLSDAPVAGLERVFKNGVRLEGNGVDYTLADRVVTLGVASIVGDRWTVEYWIRPNRGS